MSEKNPSVEEFENLHSTFKDFSRGLGTAPEAVQKIYTLAISGAKSRLAELAEDETVQAHYTRLGNSSVQALVELHAIAPKLEHLGMHEPLATKRKELMDELTGDPKLAAASYFFSIYSMSVLETQRAKKKVLIKIDPRNNLLIGEKSYSLSRDGSYTKINQKLTRQLRADAFRFFAQHPGRMFKRGEIIKGINSDMNPKSGLWDEVLREFFENAPHFDRKPIIIADTSEQKRYLYGLNPELDVTVQDTDRKLRPTNEVVLEMADGTEVTGKTGKLFNMLLRATAHRPLKKEDIIGPGKLYTQEEYDNVSEARKRTLLSSTVAVLRDYLVGTDYIVAKPVVVGRYPENNKPIKGYYIVEDAKQARIRDEKSAQ